MKSLTYRTLSLLLIGFLFGAGPTSAREVRTAGDLLGPRFDLSRDSTQLARPPLSHANSVEHWNAISIDASGLDHTPVAPGGARVYG